MICEVFELSQFCNIFIYIYTLGSSAIKRDYYAHIHVTPSCFQVLGTPTREEIKCMNPNYTEFKFPQIKPHPWHKVSLFLILLLCSLYCSFVVLSSGIFPQAIGWSLSHPVSLPYHVGYTNLCHSSKIMKKLMWNLVKPYIWSLKMDLSKSSILNTSF